MIIFPILTTIAALISLYFVLFHNTEKTKVDEISKVNSCREDKSLPRSTEEIMEYIRLKNEKRQ